MAKSASRKKNAREGDGNGRPDEGARRTQRAEGRRGGHDMIAGGRLVLPVGADWRETAARIRGRLVAAVGQQQARAVRLCGDGKR